MRPWLALVALALAQAAEGQVDSVGPGTGPPWCLPDTAALAQRFLSHLITIDTGTTPTADSLRRVARWFPDSAIVLVTDEAQCQRASAALDADFFVSPRAQPVYLARIGTAFAAFPPGYDLGGSPVIVHYDEAWQRRGAAWLW